jgi:methyltransferase (TIGR00027 family)
MIISHVMDTALWVAYYRGQENFRSDSLYNDPLALKLAGSRGEYIAKKMSNGSYMTWMMALRTKAIDELLEDAVKSGVKTIVNLGAGLDTRPYRLDFLKDVTWIEVDFAEMIAYKSEILATESPRVSLERFSVDLSQRSAAQEFYKSLEERPSPILVITEGVIPYLDQTQVANLASDLYAIKNIKYWIQDFRDGGFTSVIPRSWMKYKMKANLFKFDAPEWFPFFKKYGWVAAKKLLMHDLSKEKKRTMKFGLGISLLIWMMPKEKRDHMNRSYGFAMLTREKSPRE